MSSDSAAATPAPLDERRHQHAVVSLGPAVPVRRWVPVCRRGQE
jgi:hypothetical protein